MVHIACVHGITPYTLYCLCGSCWSSLAFVLVQSYLGAKYQCICTCDFSFAQVNLGHSHVTIHFHSFSPVTDVT